MVASKFPALTYNHRLSCLHIDLTPIIHTRYALQACVTLEKMTVSPAENRAIVTIDLSPFTDKCGSYSDTDRLKAGQNFVAACHNYGFVKIVGHGLSKQETADAFGWAKKLFALPHEEKMKAPHPREATPHRGYSGLAQEKVYSRAEVKHHADTNNDVSEELRKVSDFKVIFW
jgi:isopenicillin N synthase-like dioxygenase